MKFSAKDAIRSRRSVRTYSGEALSAQDREKLGEFIKTLGNPFGILVEFRFLDAKEHGLTSPVVSGAGEYVAAKTARAEHMEEAYGYTFEKLVLFAESIGVGTLWIAGTFNRPAFEKAMELGEGEIMPAATPVGYPAARMSLRETMMRKGIKADERLPFGGLFFAGSFGSPLTPEGAGAFREPLEMARLAPSAVNRQPWRAVVCGGTVHFYEKKTKGYIHENTGDLQRIDVGIALAHFALTAEENGLAGGFSYADPGLAADADTDYVVSFIAG